MEKISTAGNKARSLDMWFTGGRRAVARASGPKRDRDPKAPDCLKTRVIAGLVKFDEPVCLVLSGGDPATAVFQTAAAEQLQQLAQSGKLTRHYSAEADHVFSRGDWRAELSQWTLDWMLETTSRSRTKSAYSSR